MDQQPDFFKIKRNISKLKSMNAPKEKIYQYLDEEGVTTEQLQATPTLAEYYAQTGTKPPETAPPAQETPMIAPAQQQDPNAPSELGSFARGVGQGALANFGDEAIGVGNMVGTAMNKAPTALQSAMVRYIKAAQDAKDKGIGQAASDLYGDAWKSAFEGANELGNAYATGRDAAREVLDKDEATNPNSFLGGQIVGGIGTMAVPGGGLGGMIRTGVTGAARQAAGKGAVRGLENIGNAEKAVAASKNAMASGGPTFFQKLLGNAAEGAAIGGLYGAGSGEGLQDTVLSGAMGSLIGGGAGAAIPAAMTVGGKAAGLPGSMIRKSLAGKNAAEIAQAAKEEGVDLTAGMAGTNTTQKVEGWLKNLPFTEGAIQKTRDNTANQLGDRFENIAQKYGSAVGKEEAGSSLQAGGQKWLEASRQQAERAYSKLDNLVPKDMPAELPNTTSYLTEIADKFGGNTEFQRVLEAPVISQYRNLLVTGKPVPYEILKNLRSEIGKEISTPSLAPDKNRAALEGLYSSLSADMEGAAAKVPGGAEALKAANDIWRKRSEQIEGIYKKVLGQDSPEKVFNAALSGSRDGGTKLRQLKAVVGDEAWGDFVGASLRKIGTKVDENGVATFNPSQFISQMKQLPPEARQAMFGGKGPELYRNLQNLERLTAAFDKSIKGGANPSGTAGNVLTSSYFSGGVGSSAAAFVTGGPLVGMGALAAVYGVPAGASKLLTSPKFVQWLTRSASRPPTKEGFGPHLARLEIIRRNSDPETAQAIDQYKSALKNFGYHVTD